MHQAHTDQATRTSAVSGGEGIVRVPCNAIPIDSDEHAFLKMLERRYDELCIACGSGERLDRFPITMLERRRLLSIMVDGGLQTWGMLYIFQLPLVVITSSKDPQPPT